jgi:hypothetical protein
LPAKPLLARLAARDVATFAGQQILHQSGAKLAEQFLDAFAAATKAEVVSRQFDLPFVSEASSRLDLLVEVVLPGGKRVPLAIELKPEGYPRDMHQAVWQLERFSNSTHAAATAAQPFVVSEKLSPGARESLRSRGVNYFDSSGTLRFQYDTWHVDIERAFKKKRARRAAALFTDAREQVIHALLHRWRVEGNDWVSGTDLAKTAGTSSYTVSLMMKELERHEWVETQGKGPLTRRRLKNAGALLDAWAEAWTQRNDQRSRWFIYSRSSAHLLDALLPKLSRRERWAFTGAAAANIFAPLLTSVDQASVIVPPGEATEWAREIGMEPADMGPNVTLIERSGASLMFLDEHPEREGSRFASPFVQYLDLLGDCRT